MSVTVRFDSLDIEATANGDGWTCEGQPGMESLLNLMYPTDGRHERHYQPFPPGTAARSAAAELGGRVVKVEKVPFEIPAGVEVEY